MTEEEWLGCADPHVMLEFLRGKVSDRKLRLFACACCRFVWDFLVNKDSREAVLIAERYADRFATALELDTIRSIVESQCSLTMPSSEPVYDPTFWACGFNIYQDALSSSGYSMVHAALHVDFNASDYDDKREVIFQKQRFLHTSLLRDIFGNPFHPLSINPTWLTPTVNNLATIAYEERALPSGELDSARLAILADALEDEGCDNQEILGHLRGSGPHLRGCFALDLVLGRS